MNAYIRYGLVTFLLGASATALADSADTKGGLHIKSEDGNFDAAVDGRIQFDANIIQRDKDAAFGSGNAGISEQSDAIYLRRAYLTLSGKLYGWTYKFEPDFAPNNASGATTIAFQDIYIAHPVGPGLLIIGQTKPFHGLEELTSSNDLTMIERPYASAAGVFNGGHSREFEPGLFYRGGFMGKGTYGFGGYSLRRVDTATTQGIGANGRVTFAPILDTGKVVHLGLSYSFEKPDLLAGAADGAALADEVGTTVGYAGRRGPTIGLGLTNNYDKAYTLGVEVAGQLASATVQAEYMSQKLSQGSGAAKQTVDAYYVQAGYFLTGEVRAYKKDVATFGGIKPKAGTGAWEVAARFDHGQNDDLALNSAFAYTDPKAESVTVGMNWYPNANVKFMVDEIFGKAERTVAGAKQEDKPKTLALRAQLAF